MLAEKIPRYQNTDYRSDKNVRVPFNVNIGVGDGIVPRAEERNRKSAESQRSFRILKLLSL